MDTLLSGQGLIDLFNRFWAWIQSDVLVADSAVQVALVAAALGLSLLVTRLTLPWLKRQLRHPVAGRGVRIFLPLYLPLLWALLQWLSMSAAEIFDFPSRVLDSVTGLLFAWVAIHLVSQLVRNPIFSKAFVWTAWTIAADGTPRFRSTQPRVSEAFASSGTSSFAC